MSKRKDLRNGEEQAFSVGTERQRILISQPMATQPRVDPRIPQPVLATGERVQVTGFTDEHNRAVERWQLSDTDIRWYQVE